MNVTIIGHGSLMSGRGLFLSGKLRVREAFIVALAHCQRGFAKLSRYGDRFATDLQVSKLPIEGQKITPDSQPLENVEGLALTVPLEDACRLSKREGYNPDVFQKLADFACAQGLDLAAFLWRVHEEEAHDLVSYRRRLFTLTGYTSSHYIPHPVSIGGTEYALTFLAPGFEGTGSEEVVSVRQYTNVSAVMSLAETWRRKPNDDQVAYFLSCLLGGAHGVSVNDLLSTVLEEPALTEKVRTQLSEVLEHEQEQFLTATGLTAAEHRQIFGEADAALRRSGLQDFLHGA
ncbi:MAG: hypothetical protein AB7P69_11620 [Candidatus Binatia bacterium]